MRDLELNYQPREWEDLSPEDWDHLLQEKDIRGWDYSQASIYHSDSRGFSLHQELATRRPGYRSGFLLFDYEAIAAGCTLETPSVSFFKLRTRWKNHPAGSLLMMIIVDPPQHFQYWIEKGTPDGS